MIEANSLLNRSHESLEDISPDDFIDLVRPKIAYPTAMGQLALRLAEGEPLNVKLGIDPTGPDIHIGHIVPVRVLDLFSRAGHHIDLIFGDFTAKIGDPSERSTGRRAISDEEIFSNVQSYKEQVDGYFDVNRNNVTIHRNNSWLSKLTLAEVFEYLQMVNLTESTQRKDFRERMNRGSTVTLAEAMYGTLQGIDSEVLHTDVEIGGIDQLLNVQQARNVQRQRGQEAEEVLLTPIIEGTSGDGRKMSKSYNNYIPAQTTDTEMFGRIMSIPDTLIAPYAISFAPIRNSELDNLTEDIEESPMEAKKQLAVFMVGLASGDIERGYLAREEFERKFSKREINNDDITQITIAPGTSLLEALIATGKFKSRGDIRRTANGGGIRINGERLDPALLIDYDGQAPPAPAGVTVSIGKRNHYRFVITES